jgi:hypothetical protein
MNKYCMINYTLYWTINWWPITKRIVHEYRPKPVSVQVWKYASVWVVTCACKTRSCDVPASQEVKRFCRMCYDVSESRSAILFCRLTIYGNAALWYCVYVCVVGVTMCLLAVWLGVYRLSSNQASSFDWFTTLWYIYIYISSICVCM